MVLNKKKRRPKAYQYAPDSVPAGDVAAKKPRQRKPPGLCKWCAVPGHTSRSCAFCKTAKTKRSATIPVHGKSLASLKEALKDVRSLV